MEDAQSIGAGPNTKGLEVKMNQTYEVYETKFMGPIGNKGSQVKVTNLVTKKKRSFFYDHSKDFAANHWAAVHEWVTPAEIVEQKHVQRNQEYIFIVKSV